MNANSNRHQASFIEMFSDKTIEIGFTGTRHPTSDMQRIKLEELIDQLRKIRTAHHGDCVGADAEFHALCVARGILIHIHPPMQEGHRAFCEGAKKTHPPLSYLERNRRIVKACDVLFAIPSGPEKIRSGTWATIRYSRKMSVPILIIRKDGAVEFESHNPTSSAQ